MTTQNLLSRLIFLIALVIIHGCQLKATNKEINTPAIIKPIKTAVTTPKKSSEAEKPAVIYRSNNLGSTWSPFATGIPVDATLSGIKQFGNKIYVTTDYHGIFVSIAGKDEWRALSGAYLSGLDINCIEVEGNNLVIGTLKQGIFISKDSGLSWRPSKENIKSPIRAFLKSANTIYAGTDAGIFESFDMGDTWTHVFGQMQILGFTSLNGKLYAATKNGALMCEGNTKNWTSIYEDDALHDIGNDGKYIYAMTIGQQLLKTQNDGQLWENAQNGITYPTNFYTNEIQHIGNDIFSAQWIGVYHSLDNGNNWSILNGLPDSTAFSTLEITDYGIIAGISIR